MAKRGAKAKGEYAGKSSVFSTRIRPDLRSALEKATRQSDRSLSQEVEHRLRRSFEEDEKIVDLFGDRQTYRVMRMMADAIHICERPGMRSSGDDNDVVFDWLTNPAAFHLARQAIISILDLIEPGSDRPGTDAEMKAAAVLGHAVAAALFESVARADTAISVGKRSRSAAYKADLKDVLPRTTGPDHDENFRRKFSAARKASKEQK